MGTYFTNGATKESLVAEIVAGWDGVKVLDHALRGNHLWVAYESTKEDNAGERWLTVYLLVGDRGGWGYKPVDEAMGPFVYDCPNRLLNLVPEPEHNYGWRAERAKRIAADKERKAKGKSAKVGDKVRLWPNLQPNVLTLARQEGTKWFGRDENGKMWRLPPATKWVEVIR